MTRSALVLSLLASLAVLPGAVLPGCSCSSEDEEPRPPMPAELPPPPAMRYSLHEWGLLGVDATAPDTATIGTVVSHPPAVTGLEGLEGVADDILQDIPAHDPMSSGAQGGKPVIYLHVPEGTMGGPISVRVGLPVDGLLEHWPPGEVSEGALTWNATVGPGVCTAPYAPPTSDSEACRGIRDAFCEAAEIPRYYGANDTCIRSTQSETQLLFYRAAGLDTSTLPLAFGRQGRRWQVTRRTPATVAGPVLLVELERGQPRLRVLAPPHYSMPPDDDAGITPDEARTLLHREATRRGLLPQEADAFLDAWSPAYFGPCLRTGPVAHGEPPVSLAEAGRSLIYFAPQEVVDTLLPLELTPAPEARHRVFLVRYVDPASRVTTPRQTP